MPGAGTRPAITTADPPPARLLDVTRLASRAGRGLTGVDRVERAYLSHLLSLPRPVYGLARTAIGFVVLDRDGLTGLMRRIDGRMPWGPPDAVARLSRRLTPMRRRADADLRRLAWASASRFGLRWLLRRILPPGTSYVNVGHSNLTPRVLRAVRGIRGSRIAVMIHDTIPLDWPQFQREGTVDRFRILLRTAGQGADLVIANSRQTAGDLDRWFATLGIEVPVLPALLGVDVPAPVPGDLPPGMPPGKPYFVCLGTIEPRKNHALLLDVWQDLDSAMPGRCPGLLICGSRGWRNEDVFARLDALPPDGPVRELTGLSDGAVAALLQGAAGLLQPSLAEGFGLPCAEAAALQTPVICSDLPVYREMLEDIPVYLPPGDRYSWLRTIRKITEADTGQRRTTAGGSDLPTWRMHFKIVLSAI